MQVGPDMAHDLALVRRRSRALPQLLESSSIGDDARIDSSNHGLSATRKLPPRKRPGGSTS